MFERNKEKRIAKTMVFENPSNRFAITENDNILDSLKKNFDFTGNK